MPYIFAYRTSIPRSAPKDSVLPAILAWRSRITRPIGKRTGCSSLILYKVVWCWYPTKSIRSQGARISTFAMLDELLLHSHYCVSSSYFCTISGTTTHQRMHSPYRDSLFRPAFYPTYSSHAVVLRGFLHLMAAHMPLDQAPSTISHTMYRYYRERELSVFSCASALCSYPIAPRRVVKSAHNFGSTAIGLRDSCVMAKPRPMNSMLEVQSRHALI